MAGNLVKWWKHKILGGYKQFSVQECTTDSEELMYHQVRASSSCSAPPDLLLVSDRENNMPLRSPVVNIIAATTTTAPATTTTSPSSGINACHITSAANNNQHRYQQQHQQQQQKLLHHHHHQQQQQQHHQHQVTTQQLSLAYNNGCKDIIGNTGGGINAAGGTGSGGGGGKHQKQSVVVGNASTSKHGHQQQQTPDVQPSSVTHDIVDGQPLDAQTHNHSSTKQTHHHSQQQQHHNHNHNTHHQQPQRSEEHIRLEEFTCDVSVEGGKSSQPLQFSFTFYDLDGHHGKITKDDIVGIVYTIYESIGKSVVVPHSGSKTINVRLTVSPEGKTKATKNAKKSLDHHSLNLNQKTTATAAAAALASSNTQATRRLHRYRPRKLIKSDEEDDDSNSDKERDLNLSHILAHKAASKAAYKLGKLKTSEQHCCSQQHQQHQQQPALNDLPNSPLDSAAPIYDNLKASSPLEACRECLAVAAAADETRNVAATSPLVTAATTTTATTTSPAQFPAASSSKTTNEAYMKHVASTRIKMLRKSRKQKHQDCLETRQRSLSVGNETCWKNRHLQTKHSNSSNNTQQQLLWQAEQHLNNSVVGGNSNANGNGIDMVDGVQLRNPLKNTKSMMASSSTSAHKRNSAECWKTALNRNDLISIIRESMEKNRLCFQLNGKPQANVSPIRQQTNTNNPHQQTQPHNPQVAASNSSSKHTQQQLPQQQVQQRQRSNTVSKIPTLIANHNNTQSAAISPQHHHHPQRSSSCANTISNSNCNNHNHSHSHDTSLANEPYSHTNSSNSSNNHHYHHHQPHIPIYHQQMAINPAVIAAQNALLTATASGNVGSSLLQQHGKMNLCGYDSFLHATICGGGLSHSPPPPPPSAPAPAPLPAQTSTNHSPLNTQITISSNTTNLSQHQHQQQIATVQPIMAQNAASTSKHLSLAVTPQQQQQQLKSGKILRQTFNSTPSQQHHSYTNTTQNSPQYHGYQRLPSSSKHNLSALHLLSPNTEKPSLSELDKWRRDQVKSYDQLLYAKLSEKLQQTNLVSSSASNARDCNQRRKQQRVTRQRRTSNLQLDSQAITTNDSLPLTKLSNNSICLREPTTIPIVGDPLECENLLGQTSDEDINSPQDINPLQLKQASENRQVAEATLVDIDKITDELTAQKANLTVNVDTLLSVGVSETDEVVHNLHNSLHEDDLDIDEDLEEEEEEEELEEDLEEDLGQIVESGRNSNNSNNSDSNANTTNTATNNGANNSTTSSLIHRYVHEHIHHHYHHFEEKEE